MKPVLITLLVTMAWMSADAFNFYGHEYERTALGDAIDKATLKVLKEAYESGTDKNVITSPLGVMLLLSLYSAGAGPNSRQEIGNFLGGDDYKKTSDLIELISLTRRRLPRSSMNGSPTDLECDGRVSGSAQWRGGRGEGGVGGAGGHTFHLAQPATYVIRYYTDLDKYRISCDKEELESISTWNAGAYEAKNMFRKVEKDWGMVYLARREGTPTGSISWRVSCGAALRGACLRVRPGVAEYESARVRWSVAFDDLPPAPADQIGESPATYVVKFSSATVTAELSGGAGSEAWQHAQLFRQPLHATATAATATAATAATATAALEILVTVEKDL